MDAGTSTARQTRAQHRYELRTLSYVSVDLANAGIIRNLNQNGASVQMVAALRPGQRVQLRFELRPPRLRVETHGEVVWGTSSGQCGIRFLDLSPAMRRQMNEWIFGDLLDRIWLHAEGSIFAGKDNPSSGKPISEKSGAKAAIHVSPADVVKEDDKDEAVEENDGLLISASPSRAIPLSVVPDVPLPNRAGRLRAAEAGTLEWLSQPLSPRAIARVIDILAALAAFLLFAFVFLSVIREAPPWPFTFTAGTAVIVVLLYWGFFWVFGGESLGTRLSRHAGTEPEVGMEPEEDGKHTRNLV